MGKNTREKIDEIKVYIKDLIERDLLTENDKLLSIREAEDFYSANRYEISCAYNELVYEKYIINKPGSGYFVLDKNNNLSDKNQFTETENDLEVYNFYRSGYIKNLINTGLEKQFKEISKGNIDFIYNYNSKYGSFELRKEISKFFETVNGFKVNPENIIVGSSIRGIVSTLYRTISQNMPVTVEDEMFEIKSKIYKSLNCKINSASVENDGINIDEIRDDSKIIFVNPDLDLKTLNPYTNKGMKRLSDYSKENDKYVIHINLFNNFRFSGTSSVEYFYKNCPNYIYISDFYEVLPKSMNFAYMILNPELNFQEFFPSISSITDNLLLNFFKTGEFKRINYKIWEHIKKKRSIVEYELKVRNIDYKIFETGSLVAIKSENIKNIVGKMELYNLKFVRADFERKYVIIDFINIPKYEIGKYFDKILK